MYTTTPRILVTTSHRPSQRARSLAKELAQVLPGGVRVNRGKRSLQDLYYDARSVGASRVLVVATRKGNPGLILVYEARGLPEPGLREILAVSLSGVLLGREREGYQRVYGVSRLVISEDLPDHYKWVADAMAYSLLGRLGRPGPEDDVVLRLEYRGVFIASFEAAGTGRPCGPLLRAFGVHDYVSGKRVYKLRAGGRGGGGGARRRP